jgi:hypothetical protein
MVEQNPPSKSSIASQLIKFISKSIYVSLGEWAVACESCDRKLREGNPVPAFVFRPADQPDFQLGNVKCTDCRPEPTEYLTLGVRKLVLDGAMMHHAVNRAAGVEGSG